MLDPARLLPQIIDSAQEGIIVLNLNLEYVLWNPFMERLHGKSAREVLGKHPWDVFPLAREQGIEIILKRALSGETVTMPDLFSASATGGVQWKSAVSAPLKDENGNIIGVMVIVRDVTERKLAELKLAEAELRFRALIEHSHEAIVLLGADAKKLYASPGIEAITGYTDKEFMKREVFSNIAPADAGKVRELCATALRNPGKTQVAEVRFIHKDGSTRWTEAVGSNLLHVQGVNAIVINFRDISERKVAELKLAEADLRFRALIEHSYEAIVLVDAMARKLYVSPSITRITGYSAEEFLERDSFSLVYPEDVERTRALLAESIQKPLHPVMTELRILHKNGSPCWIEVVVRNLIGVQGVGAIVANLRDIEDRKKAEDEKKKLEAQIQHAQRLESLGVLAGGIAHDFNNLLVGILGNTDLALSISPRSRRPARAWRTSRPPEYARRN